MEDQMTQLDLGPFMLGGNVFGWTADRDASFAVLDAFVDRGGRAIDTADAYSQWVPGNTGGDSERILGEWFASRGRRDDVVVATKVFSLATRPGLSPANIAAAVDDSLQRLQTDRIDLYFAHRDDESVPQEDYLAAFDALVRAGKVREVGASNFTPDRLRSAAEIASDAGLTPVTVAQDGWNLVRRDVEAGLVPTLRELGIVETPYAALASGYLTGKYRGGATVDSPRAAGAQRYADDPRNVAVLDVLGELADAHGVASGAVAIAWLAAQDVVAAPIASARSVEQLGTLFDGAELALSADEVERLSAVTAPQA
jgi:aryl-alcohol dehydrogenase-like predicted oxidoreductase